MDIRGKQNSQGAWRVTNPLGPRAALAVTVLLAGAVGGAVAGTVWISMAGLQDEAESAGRRAAAAAAAAIEALAEPSAANIARTFDVVLDDELRAQAAATALLVEAAEAAGHESTYIEDALRQIAFRSPIARIDLVAIDGTEYSTERDKLRTPDLEPEFEALLTGTADLRTAATAARGTEDGLRKAAAATTQHRTAVVRIEQALDGPGAAETYGGADDDGARRLADQQAEAIARLTAHAVELGEDAGWGGAHIEARLDALVEHTSVFRAAARAAGGRAVYAAGPQPSQDPEPTTGRYDPEGRWIARADADRANGRLRTEIELTTRAGAGSLAQSTWQTEATRLAAGEDITAVWIAEVAPDAVRVPVTATAHRYPTESTWGSSEEHLALDASQGGARSEARLQVARGTGTVTSAAPAGTNHRGDTVAVVIRTDASATIDRMRQQMAIVGAAGIALIGVLAMLTTAAVQRWLTRPIESMAAAARLLRNGERPPPDTISALGRRHDEIGSLARSFGDMTEDVLARHEDLSERVRQRTASLQTANEKLEATQDRVRRELKLARQVQESIVPAGSEITGQLAVSSRVTPARELGGDFITTHEHKDGSLIVAVCDVSGKGVGAALFMAIAQAALTTIATRSKDVRRIAEHTNRRLCDGNVAGMFVTGWIGRFSPDGDQLEYTCAGHEPPILLAGGMTKKLELNGHLPLGLDDKERYSRQKQALEAGDTIIAYTDGVTDAQNPDHTPFGEERLQEVTTRAAGGSPERIIQDIWTSIDLFSGPTAATDDKTCMVIRRLQRSEIDDHKTGATAPPLPNPGDGAQA